MGEYKCNDVCGRLSLVACNRDIASVREAPVRSTAFGRLLKNSPEEIPARPDLQLELRRRERRIEQGNKRKSPTPRNAVWVESRFLRNWRLRQV